MNTWLLVGGALALDTLLGDPETPLHPTRLIGKLASAVEGRLRPGSARPFRAGLLGWMLVVGSAAAFGFCVLEAAEALGSWVGGARAAKAAASGASVGRALASIFLLYVSMAPRALASHALAVARALGGDGGLEAGRRAVSLIVGRDTGRLDEAGVVKACVESVAESAVDGVAAPIFWALVLGPLGAVVYRAINTLDSMWGYKSERYLHFGRFAARADDVANWLPARLAFLAAPVASALLGLDARACLFLGWRDRRKHESPNAAWLEAAFAGALGLGLGGPAWYGGEMLDKPRLGEARRLPERRDISLAIALMYATVVVFSIASILFRGILLALLARVG